MEVFYSFQVIEGRIGFLLVKDNKMSLQGLYNLLATTSHSSCNDFAFSLQRLRLLLATTLPSSCNEFAMLLQGCCFCITF